MTASAYPGVDSYEWFKETDTGLEKIQDDLRTDPRIRVQGGILKIFMSRREDSGFYTVKARNAEGISQTKIEVNVLFPPK